MHALICARASIATVSHFHHVEQTRSQFTPHPLRPHGNACYYSRIILNSLLFLLFSELFWHNYLRPSCKSCKIIWTGFLSSCLMQLVSIINELLPRLQTQWRDNGSERFNLGLGMSTAVHMTRIFAREQCPLLCIALSWCFSKLPSPCSNFCHKGLF